MLKPPPLHRPHRASSGLVASPRGYAYGLCASGFGADLVVEADLGALPDDFSSIPGG